MASSINTDRTPAHAKKPFIALALTNVAAVSTYANAADSLTMGVYNPGKTVFSEIISGKHEVTLINAQFQRNDVELLVNKIKATGKKLTIVYISHSDADFYFGLDVIKAAFRRPASSQRREQLKK